MKTIIISFTTLITLFSCNQSNNRIIEKWDNGSPKVVIEYKSIEDSIYKKIEYFENGKIKSIQDYEHGKLNGKVINFSEKGFKSQEFDYVDGKKNGIGTGWYKSGKISFQFKYKDDLYYDGTEYFDNGWPRVLVNFSAPGERNGKAIYYNEDGSIWMEGFFKNGKEDSIWIKFDKQGNMVEKLKYEDGKVVLDKE